LLSFQFYTTEYFQFYTTEYTKLTIYVCYFAEGLLEKFESKPFKKLLLETGTRMLVHTPMRGKTDYWTGRVDKTSGNITGENNMGKLLMEVRQELRKPKKSSQKEGKRIGAIKDKGKSKFVDKNKDDDDIKDENKDDDDIKDDNQKGGDVIKGDDESTTSKTKDSPGYKAAKRKHEGNDVQVKYPDEEVSESPKIKRKKIEEKSKDVLESKEESEDGDKNKDDDKKGGVEHKGDDAETSRETMDGSRNKGEKRKREGNDVQVECLDEEVPEGPNIKRKKIEDKSKDVLEGKDENKDGDKNKDDDKKGGVEDKDDDAETSRETMDGSENKGEKRKRDGNDVQVECLDEEVPEGPNISRKKTEEESKDDLENKSGDENKSDGEETTHETKE
jgi:hypothetical protein